MINRNPVCDRATGFTSAGGQAIATVACRELGLGSGQYIAPTFIPQSSTTTGVQRFCMPHFSSLFALLHPFDLTLCNY
jgi:hypothetical protein